MNVLRTSISGLLGVLVVCFLSWCAGYDFSSRGDAAFATALVALCVGVACAMFNVASNMNAVVMVVVAAICAMPSDAEACSRCGLFGNRCKFVSHVAVAPVAIIKQPEVFVIQNNYPAANGAAFLAQQGGAVYGFNGAAQAYTLDPAAVLRQAADLARGAQSLAQVGLDGYNVSAGLALQLNAQVQEPLAKGAAAAAVLNAAGLSQPSQATQQAIRLYRDGSGRWQVENLEAAAVSAKVEAQTQPVPVPVADPNSVGVTVAAKCSQCHGLSLAEPKGGLYLDRGHSIDCRQSLKAISAVMSGKMPKGQALTAEERTALVNELVALGKAGEE